MREAAPQFRCPWCGQIIAVCEPGQGYVGRTGCACKYEDILRWQEEEDAAAPAEAETPRP